MARKSPSRTIAKGSLADRLQVLADRNGGLANLAREASINASVLTRCLDGGAPSVATARAICAAAGVSLDWFLSGKGSDSPQATNGVLKIPLFSAEASAGPGLVPVADGEPEDFLFIPSGALTLQSGVAADLFALHARGDSMEPTLRNGALLIANKADQQAREGIYVIVRGDALLVKRTQIRENQTLRLKSDNTQYDDEEIDLKSPVHGLKIIGRVIWAGHSI